MVDFSRGFLSITCNYELSLLLVMGYVLEKVNYEVK